MNLRHIAPLFAAAFLAACSGEDRSADLGGAPPPPVATARELSTLEAGPFAVVKMDGSRPLVARIGSQATTCADGVKRAACEVEQIDLSRADLTERDEAIARAKIEGGLAVVKGKLARDRLVVSEVWLRHAASPTLANERPQTAGAFVLRDVRGACAGAPSCAWLMAEPLEGGRAVFHEALDVSLVGGALGASEEEALARGHVMAYGATVGKAFAIAAIYLPFPEAPVAGAAQPR